LNEWLLFSTNFLWSNDPFKEHKTYKTDMPEDQQHFCKQ